jgi:hypothetical protein
MPGTYAGIVLGWPYWAEGACWLEAITVRGLMLPFLWQCL